MGRCVFDRGSELRLRSVRALRAAAGVTDVSTRAAGLGGALFVAGGLVVAGTEWWLPRGADRVALLVLATCAVGCGLVVPLLPWRRWPRRAFIVLPVLGHVLLAVGWVVAPTSMPYYLALYVLCYLYAGVTQDPGVSLWLLPVTLTTLLLEATSSSSLLVNSAIVTMTAVLVAEVLAAYTSRERRARDHVASLLEATRRLGCAESVEDAAAVAAELATTLLRCDVATVYVAEREHPDRYRNRVPGASGALEVNIATEQTGIGVALRTGETVYVADATTSPIVSRRLVEATGTKSALFVPLPGRAGWAGAMAITWVTPHRRLDPLSTQVLEVLGAEAGRVLERLLASERLAAEVCTDPLTALGNRRGWDQALASIAAEDTVIMLDLDRFKDVNDRLGHAAGDQVLRAMAACLRSAARTGDCIVRYGGEEFAILLKSAGDDAARAYLDRVAVLWEADGAVTTYSAGCAVHHEGDAAHITVRHADDALYLAKSQGRNRAVVHVP
jgi:diguanylate cyclase (GGDEF)-like protein